LLLPGLKISVAPGVSKAAAQALCMELLEVGAWMLPCMDEG
jgi:hypothetical protein